MRYVYVRKKEKSINVNKRDGSEEKGKETLMLLLIINYHNFLAR